MKSAKKVKLFERTSAKTFYPNYTTIKGKIPQSKFFLEKMKKNLMDQLKYNQSMEKTNEAIHRLSTINENQHSNLMQLNIQRFYYSISEETLNKDFTILSQGKKEHESSFDVRRTSYDGAELCGLIGIYIQSFLETILENDQMGL